MMDKKKQQQQQIKALKKALVPYFTERALAGVNVNDDDEYIESVISRIVVGLKERKKERHN